MARVVWLLFFFFFFFFLGCCAARDLVPPGPVDAVVGKNVTLRTLLDQPVFTFIIWNFENTHVLTLTPTSVIVNAPYLGRVSVDERSGSLHLGALTKADSGDYSVTVVAANGTTETGGILLRVAESLVIRSSVSEAVEHNDTVVLTCTAIGSFQKFTWLNGTSPMVVDGQRLVLKENDTSSQLTITGVLRTDLAGPVYCTASNKVDVEKSAPFSLPVHYGPDPIALTPADVPRFLQAGADFNLTCSTRSSPAASIRWYQNQSLLETAGSVLALSVVQQHPLWRHMSTYTCRAANAKTLRQVSSPGATFSVIEPVLGVNMSGPSGVLMAGNSTANLSCRATAGTVTTRTWLKDGQPVAGGGRVTLSADGGSLMIAPLQKEDNGEFQCQFANPVSSQRASYKMVVMFGPEAVAVSGQSAVEVRGGVTLTCSAASVPPANFTWKFNGTLTDVKTAAYVIGEAVYKNTGAYMCQAHNAVTGKTATHTHNLSVREEGTLQQGLSDGAIAGIIIGILAALALAIGLIFYCRQKVPVESPY
ncbi:carcinoembryonic antigen-related cell adhesion molecule 2-like [Nerophis ophidion]|uniref:carcinoembryonic antigen-related cell adhesion molecule 2-like n=1 Tax=Nerophis ophidion TaxID=159077 RepID=UPI002AE0AEB3|nr:carcinoembryonic antigen-related cell adhesion molecule 2-like [Nerophis ophidion]XP_061752719.1 carcinoembryonic antigen-related cell adhesion molecule 2-like [Nerophis ophidion]